jgi:hypothetical protein
MPIISNMLITLLTGRQPAALGCIATVMLAGGGPRFAYDSRKSSDDGCREPLERAVIGVSSDDGRRRVGKQMCGLVQSR